jgi:predicted ATPase/DNA-binding SARP family transcriptional activator/tetratricopeptide (TPR) repeat protein
VAGQPAAPWQAGRVHIALLGPLEVHDDSGAPVRVAGARLQRLLTRLALSPGQLVTSSALIDAVWGDEPPAGATSALQSLVHRLRRALPGPGADLLEARPGGYRLSAPPDAVDAVAFERLAAAGRAAQRDGDLADAARLFTDALGLWRGEPFADARGADFAAADFTAAARVRLDELRLRTIEDRIEAELALQPPGERVAELRELIAAHPLRERLCALHMRALWLDGRPAEALASFAALRRSLAEALGTDPAPGIRDLHTAILRGDAGAVTAPPAPSPAGNQAAGNLPAALTSFVGRDEELSRLGPLLAAARLVTLVGPGGAGKTRLAVEAAARWSGEAGEGAWLVELAGVTDQAQVAAAVLTTLGLREGVVPSASSGSASAAAGPADPAQRVVAGLRGRQLLIVLDNCEHLAEACARLAGLVTAGCPRVRIMATSREPLGVTGEHLFPVGPLAVGSPAVGIGDAPGIPALRLFADRATAVRPSFRLTAENLPAVAEICRRLDGLPLAIELACARLRTLPLAEIATRLGDRFTLLSGGSRAALPRHQTLRAVVDWSWELLDPSERLLASRLSVFSGGATAESAEAVCGRVGAADMLDVLGALADKSFVELREVAGAPPRYRMLDTIRAFAAERLAETGEAAQVHAAHAAYFLSQAEIAEPALRTAGQLPWLSWLAREYDNLTAALRWSIETGDAATAVRLTTALGWFWILRSDHREAATWSTEALAQPGAAAPGEGVAAATGASGAASWAGPADRLAVAYAFDALHHFAVDDLDRATCSAEVMRQLAAGRDEAHPALMAVGTIIKFMRSDTAGVLADLASQADRADQRSPAGRWTSAAASLMAGQYAEHLGDAGTAGRHFAAGHRKFAEIGDRWGVASALGSLGTSLSLSGDHATTIAALGEAAELAEAIGAQTDAGHAYVRRGLERLRAGDAGGARADLTRGRDIGRAHQSELLMASAGVALGELARQTGNLAEAQAQLTGVLLRMDAPEQPEVLPQQARARALTALGRVSAARGDLASARGHLAGALRLGLACGDRPVIADVADALAALAVAGGQPERAARMLGLATATRGLPDRGSPDVAAAESAARAGLGPRYDRAYTAAARLSPAAATAALAERVLGAGRQAGP